MNNKGETMHFSFASKTQVLKVWNHNKAWITEHVDIK